MSIEEANARRQLEHGLTPETLSAVRTAIQTSPNPIEWVHLALEMRDAGRNAEAGAVLSTLVGERAAFVPAYYELAFLLRLEGNHRKAAAILASGLKHDPNSFRMRLFLAHMLYAVGASSEGDAVLVSASPTNVADRLASDTMFAFGRYIKKNPLGRSMVLHDRLLARNEWLNNERLFSTIAQAISESRPFSFVRLGDGEGGVLSIDEKDEAEHRPLYEQNRQELIAMWFGHSFPWQHNEFFNLSSKLMNAIEDCDVVGIPYESWIQHEYRISSLRGIPSLVNVIHAFLLQKSSSRLLASQLAHLELFKSGKLGELMRLARRVSIISCLDALPGAIKQKFELDEVISYRIPGEQGSRHLLGEKTVEGIHFPDRYYQLQAELSHPHNGRLFLIAGGFLGKLYAMTIRQHGGIAVDIGSVADTWAGHATRPGYSGSDSLL